MCGQARFHKLGVLTLLPGLKIRSIDLDGSGPSREYGLSRNRFARVENGIWRNYPHVLLPDIDSVFEGLFEFKVGNSLCIVGIEHPEFYEYTGKKKVVSIMTIGKSSILIEKQQQDWVNKVLDIHPRAPVVIPVKNRELLLLEKVVSC